MRIHVCDHAEADAAWRILAAAPDGDFRPAEIYLDGHGPLYRVVRTPDGDQTSAPLSDPPARSA